jgi:hypothetical protein
MAVQAGGHGALEILRDLPRTGADSRGYSQALEVSFWNAAHLVLLVPLTGLTWIAWRLGRALGLHATATLIFPVLIALASVTQGRPRLRTGVLVALGASSAAAGIAFSRGVWIA